MSELAQNPQAPRRESPEASGRRSHRLGARAYLATLASSVFIQGATLIQGVLVARVLGPVGRGQFAAAILWPSWFAPVGLLGIDAALARRAGGGQNLPALYRTAVLLGTATSAVSTVAAYLLLPALIPAAEHGLLLLAQAALLLIPLNNLIAVLQAVDQGSGRFGMLNLSRSVLYPVYLAGLGVMVILHTTSVAWVIHALVLSNVAVLAMLAAVRRRELLAPGGLVRPVLPIVREGLRYGALTIAVIIHSRVDQVLLVWLLPMKEFGIYVVALSAAGVLSSAAAAFSMVCFTHAAQAPPREGFPLIARDFRRAALVCLAVSVVAVPALPIALPLVYGREFAGSASLATALLAGSVLAGLSQILDQALRGQGRPDAALVGRFVAVAVGCVAGLVFTRTAGALGMALAFDVHQLTYLLVLASSAMKHYRDASPTLLRPTRVDARELLTAVRTVGARLRARFS